MIPTLNVVLRTCDRVSLADDRIFPKSEIIPRCLRSLITSLRHSQHNYCLHIVDDASSAEMQELIQQIAPEASFNFLQARDQSELTGLQKSRYSVGVAYDYIRALPDNELVYIVEDDYLHYPQSISVMLGAWQWFSQYDETIDVGIFPQDFNQLYLHPDNPFNEAYIRPCLVVPGPDRYYRTTWYTHESFMIKKSVIDRYWQDFKDLQNIGFEHGKWEGNTISNVWQQPEIRMLMPMPTLAIHLSKSRDISFYVSDLDKLWQKYQ